MTFKFCLQSIISIFFETLKVCAFWSLSVIHFSGFLRSWFAQGVVAVVILESNTQVTADRDNRADIVKK